MMLFFLFFTEPLGQVFLLETLHRKPVPLRNNMLLKFTQATQIFLKPEQ